MKTKQASTDTTKPSESEADKTKRESGHTEHSSHDHSSREKAGSKEGAGGGAKQKQQH